MPRTPRFLYRNTPSGWMVNVPASVSESGKRERHFHKTRDAAKDHAAGLRAKFLEHGAQGSAIRPSLAEDATRASAILGRWGLSLTDAARLVAAQMEKHEASVAIEEAAAAWLESLEGLRPRSIQSYEATLRRLLEALPGRALSTITAEEIEAAIKRSEAAVATYALHRRNARAFWHWSAKKGWCEKGLFDNVAAPRKTLDKEIEFLTPEQASTLLHIAEQRFPQAVSTYALALFAGIRAEELRRLEEHHVSSEGINLPPEVTKRGRRRHITPSDTLRAWLAEYPYQPCPNWKQVDCAVRRLAGWDVAAALLEAPPAPTLGRWPQNALRHSHASYSVAAGCPLEALLFEFGHVGGVEILRKHYLGRATRGQAEQFFALRPAAPAH